MDINSKAITEIRYPDIRAFLEAKHPESEILDYKRDFPKPLRKLASSIAAFANTDGGIILLGVAEDRKTGLPVLPPVGIDIGAGEDEVARRIQSVAYDDIWHPVAPEIAVCRTEADPNRAVVLIRISESHETPHWTENRQHACVRVGSQNRFIDRLANAEELARLWNRREGPVNFRESLIRRARERVALMALATAQGGPAQQPPLPHVVTEAYAVPYYPDHPRMDLAELLRFARKESGTNRMQPELPFPLDRDIERPIDDGVAVLFGGFRVAHLVQADYHGLLHSWQHTEADVQRSGTPFFRAKELLAPVEGFLDYLAKLWECFEGLQAKPMLLSISLALTSGSRLGGIGTQTEQSEPIYESRIQLLDEILKPPELRASLDSLVRVCARRLFWASGYSFAGDPQKLDEVMDGLYRR